MTIPDSSALMGLGASGCASGSHVCRGTIADFTPNPTIRVAKIKIVHGVIGTPLIVEANTAKFSDPVIP